MQIWRTHHKMMNGDFVTYPLKRVGNALGLTPFYTRLVECYVAVFVLMGISYPHIIDIYST